LSGQSMQSYTRATRLTNRDYESPLADLLVNCPATKTQEELERLKGNGLD